MTPLLGYVPGIWELAIIGGIVLLFFGNRLPGVMRSLGTGIVEFKKGVSGIEDQTDDKSTSTSTSDKETETVDK